MVKNEIVLKDGTVLTSGVGVENAIRGCRLTQYVNDGKELTPGSVCSACLEVELIVPQGSLHIPVGDCITLNTNGRQVGVFVPEKPVRTGSYGYQVTAFDKVCLLDKELSGWLAGLDGWPYSLSQFASMVCQACGLVLATTQMPNGDFSVRQFSRAQVTGRQLMRWIGQIACRFCYADSQGEICLGWYRESEVVLTPGAERFYYEGSLQYEDYQVSPVDGVKLRPLGSAAGVVWPEGDMDNPYIIASNPILNAQVDDGLLPYFDVIRQEIAALGDYRPCTVTVSAGLDIQPGDIVTVEDAQGLRFRTCVMVKIRSGQRDTVKCTGSLLRGKTPGDDQNIAQIVTDVLDRQTSQEIFNKLTEDGAIQGIYIQDGKWYINAEVTKIINLIVDHVLSTKDEYSLEIDAARLRMKYGNADTVWLENYGNAPVLYMHEVENGRKIGSSELAPNHLKLGGTSINPILELSTYDKKVRLWLNGQSEGKYLSWKSNGDGTYMLVGS